MDVAFEFAQARGQPHAPELNTHISRHPLAAIRYCTNVSQFDTLLKTLLY